MVAARRVVGTLLPVKRALGDGASRPFLRRDLGGFSLDEETVDAAEFATYEALAEGADLITGAVLTHRGFRLLIDVLARQADGTYLPVIVTNHRVARKTDSGATTPMIAVQRLGLGKTVEAPYRLRHHASDGYRLALIARALDELGVDGGRGGAIGQDRTRVFVTSTEALQPALDKALAAGWSDRPRRLKECATCRFWNLCEPELREMDDISLVLPGDTADKYRDRGITTVQGLIDADLGEPSTLAFAWRHGIPLVKRVPEVTGPRAEVEVDVDMEAYLDQGAYLWGAFDGSDYRGFVTWDRLGGQAEAENFAKFWQWLMSVRAQAHADGKTFAAYCYSAHGENHWLTMSARRFAGVHEGVPDEQEVADFISSDEWVDVFTSVKSQFIGPEGLGLKVVAPQTGYTWRTADMDGEESVNARRVAVSDLPESEAARYDLLTYNEDDTRATAALRQWLRAGAPGVPGVVLGME